MTIHQTDRRAILGNRLIIAALLLLTTACGKGNTPRAIDTRTEPATTQEQTVIAFVEAFNAHDPAAMAQLCTPTLQWGYVEGVDHAIAGNGRQALITAMERYFETTPAVRSEVVRILSHNDTVAITERVSWTPANTDQPRLQASVAVYQLEEGLINAVWYYPASAE